MFQGHYAIQFLSNVEHSISKVNNYKHNLLILKWCNIKTKRMNCTAQGKFKYRKDYSDTFCSRSQILASILMGN
jgi:hypothetical protein